MSISSDSIELNSERELSWGTVLEYFAFQRKEACMRVSDGRRIDGESECYKRSIVAVPVCTFKGGYFSCNNGSFHKHRNASLNTVSFLRLIKSIFGHCDLIISTIYSIRLQQPIPVPQRRRAEEERQIQSELCGQSIGDPWRHSL